MKRLLVYALLLTPGLAWAQSPDDIKGIRHRLETERVAVRAQLKNRRADLTIVIRRMLTLGLWPEAATALTTGERLRPADRLLLRAEYAWLNNDFRQTELLVSQVLAQDAANTRANRLQATLAIEAWTLQRAVDQCRNLLAKNPADEETWLVLGRALLLQKRYPDALAVAKKLQQANPNLAAAYLLEANVYFWNQQPAQAEAPLIKSLTLNPFDADARFSYGYAIWRRIDATQLNAMADQWQLALDLNPLHFQAHWHWGNGHTNRTYADYADKDEKAIRDTLRGADRLFRARRLPEAVALVRRIEPLYPASVLPAMHRASLYYSDFDIPGRWAALDSAETLFRGILARKPHYGPAHNGLSAVIKSKRIPYLAQYDSITNVLRTTTIADAESFGNVFPDLSYYAGTFARNMVWNQLYTSVVYFPFLSKQGNGFVVPPLHNDLSIAMRSPYFRFSTTFDNRQWMDIRGVGSGAAAIEYVERGAYQERNVVLHEYVHLFHGRVLTDAESRRIRTLYYAAMQENRTLDYYSQNNESEYFAQTYPAYFEPTKVHPLDFKSMNTTAELKQKDPAMYAFLDSLVRKERAYLAGNQSAMATNWSQVYLNMSSRLVKADPARAARYLDTALVYDRRYQPAYLAYARLKQEQKEFDAAHALIKNAEAVNPNYAPVYAAYASLEEARQTPGRPTGELVISQARWLQKAVDLETDYQSRAGMAIQLREVYAQNSQLGAAIKAAEVYAAGAPNVSTYLRDRRDEAIAFAAAQRALLGHTAPLDVLQKMVGQRPQNFDLRGLFADALLATGRYQEAVATITEAQRILASSKNARTDFNLRLAEGFARLNQPDSVKQHLGLVLADKSGLDPLLQQRLVRLLAGTGQVAAAETLINTLPTDGTPRYRSSALLSKGIIQQQSGKPEEAIVSFSQSVQCNPYNLDSQKRLADLYRRTGKLPELAAWRTAINQLDIKPGDAAGL